MLVTRINLQLPVHLLAEFGFWQHTGNRFLHHTGGAGCADFLRARFDQTSRITRETPINLLGVFPARQFDLFGVNHDHMIARIEEGRINRLMFAHQNSRSMAGEFAEDNVIGIDYVPVSFNSRFGREHRTHEHTTPSLVATLPIQANEPGSQCQTDETIGGRLVVGFCRVRAAMLTWWGAQFSVRPRKTAPP